MIFLQNNKAKSWTLFTLVGACLLVVIWQWAKINPIQSVNPGPADDTWQQIYDVANRTGQDISDSIAVGTQNFGEEIDKQAKQQALVEEAQKYLSNKNNTTSTSTENISE